MEQKRKREKMRLTSEVMRGWAEGLRREVEDWPGVTLKSAFGMTLVYRSSVVFAALPGTRALYEEDAILVEILGGAAGRFGAHRKRSAICSGNDGAETDGPARLRT
jgi:hypothetical protein